MPEAPGLLPPETAPCQQAWDSAHGPWLTRTPITLCLPGAEASFPQATLPTTAVLWAATTPAPRRSAPGLRVGSPILSFVLPWTLLHPWGTTERPLYISYLL